MKRQWSIIAAILLIILVSLFAMANMESVPVQFGFAAFTWPLIMVILGSLFAGALIATLLSTYALFHARRDKKETQKRVDELERNQTARADETKASYEEKVSKLKEEKEQLLQQVRQLERENRNRAASRLTENGEAVRFKNEETY